MPRKIKTFEELEQLMEGRLPSIMFIVSGVDSLNQRYYWNGIGWDDDSDTAALLSEQCALAVVKRGHSDLISFDCSKVKVTME